MKVDKEKEIQVQKKEGEGGEERGVDEHIERQGESERACGRDREVKREMMVEIEREIGGKEEGEGVKE